MQIVKELPVNVKGYEYTPMIVSDQSQFEDQYSKFQGSDHNSGDKYTGVTGSKSIIQLML